MHTPNPIGRWSAVLLLTSISFITEAATLPVQQNFFKAHNTAPGALFGGAVALSGDTLVVGDAWESSDFNYSGAVYVFVRSGTNWTQQAFLKSPDAAEDTWFGYSVALWGETLVVGAPNLDLPATPSTEYGGNVGAAYVFVREGTNWIQQARLRGAELVSGSFSGGSVAVFSNTIVVGAIQQPDIAVNSGAAYVFEKNGTNWVQTECLRAPAPAEGQLFGRCVSLSGDTLAVGSLGLKTAFIFRRSSTGWLPHGSVEPYERMVCVSGDTILTTAYSEEDGPVAHIFVQSGTNWVKQAELKENRNLADGFGYSASLWGDSALIGAPQEASKATGVNGNETDTGFQGAGAAYLFHRRGTNWSRVAYLKASNTRPENQFGFSVCIAGDEAVIGAVTESSDSTGVNGSQSNTGANFSGAAFHFTNVGIGGALAIARASGGARVISLKAVPGTRYQLERSQSLTGTTWEPIATNSLSAAGTLQFFDTAPVSGQVFYRVLQR
jgi:hypothetical protein